MQQLHLIRETNYERMRRLSVKEQIKTIHSEAEPMKIRLLEKIKNKETQTTSR